MFALKSIYGAMGVVWATPLAESVSAIIAIGLFASFMVKLNSSALPEARERQI